MPEQIMKFLLGPDKILGVPDYGQFEANIPQGATPRSVNKHDGQLILWAQADPAQPTETRTFAVLKTGDPIPENSRYTGTATPRDSPLQPGNQAWHVFELHGQDRQEKEY